MITAEIDGIGFNIMLSKDAMNPNPQYAGKKSVYTGELTTAGFSFDTQPDIDSEHMEFLAFKDSSMISFAYKGEENLVSIEYQK